MSQNKHKPSARRSRRPPAWPLAIAVGGFLLLLGAVVAFNQPSKSGQIAEDSGTPILTVDKEKVDLGDVQLGQTVQVSFQITNAGDGTLRFAKQPYVEVKAGC
jgi:hypothetical protein